jgi:hypothetical protein
MRVPKSALSVPSTIPPPDLSGGTLGIVPVFRGGRFVRVPGRKRTIPLVVNTIRRGGGLHAGPRDQPGGSRSVGLAAAGRAYFRLEDLVRLVETDEGVGGKGARGRGKELDLWVPFDQ